MSVFSTLLFYSFDVCLTQFFFFFFFNSNVKRKNKMQKLQRRQRGYVPVYMRLDHNRLIWKSSFFWHLLNRSRASVWCKVMSEQSELLEMTEWWLKTFAEYSVLLRYTLTANKKFSNIIPRHSTVLFLFLHHQAVFK